MSAYILLTGALHRDPVTRTAKTGKDFVTAILRSESQGETLWVNVAAFDGAAQAELMRLKAGEALTIQGTLKVSVYEKNGEQVSVCEKNGEHRASLDVVASQVTALRRLSGPAEKRAVSPGPAGRVGAPGPEFNDELPAW